MLIFRFLLLIGFILCQEGKIIIKSLEKQLIKDSLRILYNDLNNYESYYELESFTYNPNASYYNIKNKSKNFILNVGVFSDKKNIEKIKIQLKGLGKINIEKSKNDSSLYKVFLGPFGSKNFVYRVQRALSDKGLKDSVIEILD